MTLSKSKTSSLAAVSSSASNSTGAASNGAASNHNHHHQQQNQQHSSSSFQNNHHYHHHHHQNGSTSGKRSTTNNYQECADCSSPSASWASLNHGVVVCDHCCLAHRSLGRAISIIKSLKKSYWPQSQIDTLYELVRNNSNNIWEANLSNADLMKQNPLLKNLKKPTPKDNYSTKFNFVKIKYENLSLIARSKYSSIDELNQQLMASVRGNDLKATLRILSQGADANYRNSDDGLQCLHAAVLANEIGQIELLCLYGADVTGLDRNGLTPLDLARINGLQHIADRLVELQFELTDELSSFLCNKRPDHKGPSAASHFLIPDRLIDNGGVSLKEFTNRLKLDDMPDHLFEELAKDIYDEMDRRQIEQIWKCTVSANLVNEPIPFLVIKSCFTQMRNQLRQKLARFNTHEFSSILIEILNESQRRYNQIESPAKEAASSIENNENEEDDEDPLYDKVPSDEDYASVASESSSTIQVDNHLEPAAISPPQPLSSYPLVKPNKLNLNKSTSENNNKPTNYHQTHHHYYNQQQQHSPSSPMAAQNHSASSSPSNKSPAKLLFPSSREHKILNTRFEKVPMATTAAASAALATSSLPSGVLSYSSCNASSATSNNSALVANAESCLNSIINSLNQIDYSHLNPNSNSTSGGGALDHRNYCGMTTADYSYEIAHSASSVSHHGHGGSGAGGGLSSKLSMASSTNGERFGFYNELKNENELMQAMIERLMDENAQLRAEKMLLATKNNMTSSSSSASAFAFLGNVTAAAAAGTSGGGGVERTSAKFDELSLYSTIKNNNKKLVLADKLPQQQSSYFLDEYNSDNNGGNLMYDDNNSNLEIIEEGGVYQYDEEALKFNKTAKSFAKSPNSLTPPPPMQQQQQQPPALLPPSVGVQQSSSASGSGLVQDNAMQPCDQETDSNNKSELLPSKDAVIRAMKKITRAVQDLFKATKLSDFASLKTSCELVNQVVHEMISLFPAVLNSPEIEENLIILEETCKKLNDLMNEYNSKIELFVNTPSNETDDSKQTAETTTTTTAKQMSASSSSSSAISSSNSDQQFNNSSSIKQQQQQLSADDVAIKNMIITNLVSYSYEIAHTVKRIVCVMGADN